MKFVLVVLGLIIVVAGTGFAFQSLGQLGPPSSFMFRNQDWTGYGLAIALAGAVVTTLGILRK